MKYKNYYSTPKYSDGDKTYYGNVSGVPDIPMIEAASLDDYERLFRQAVDDYLGSGSAKKAKWGWIAGVAIVGLLIIMALTCPKKEKHVEVLNDRVSFLVNDALGEQEDELKFLGLLFGNSVTRPFVSNNLSIDDYIFFNVGKFSYNGKEHTVSVGALGHVFSISRRALRDKAMENPDLKELLESL